MKFFKYTNKGPRNINEDSFYISESANTIYACVADGVGGFKHGDFASNFIVKEFEKKITINSSVDLNLFVNEINRNLIDIAKNELKVDKIATTFTAGIISDKLIRGVHVGDSRICVLRGNGIKQLTDEHSEVGRLVREGKLNPEDRKTYPRKNIIESIIGYEDLFTMQNFQFDLLVGDRIIFSTDGFHESISKLELRDISIKIKSFEEFCRKLIIELENRILHDNSTFLCIEI
jgi:serine/threonine protein phosphatase PrpC